MIITVFNFKGGVGKSTTVGNLGASLATNKRPVLLLDLDPQRSLSFATGTEGKSPTVLDLLKGKKVAPVPTSRPHLSIFPAHFDLLNFPVTDGLIGTSLKGIKGYEVILIDCPPAINATSVEAILSSDLLMIPIVCEPAVLKGVAEAIELIREEKPSLPIKVLRGRYRPRLVLTREADQLLTKGAKELNFELLKTTIPDNIAIAEAVSSQVSVLEYAPSSVGAKAFKKLAKEMING